MKPEETRGVLITGCSSGIGRCVARGLHARGYRVFATARGAADVAALAAEGLESLPLDVSDSDSISAAVVEVLRRVVHALESPHPRTRYRVSVPTYLFWALKRALPQRALDGLLARVG